MEARIKQVYDICNVSKHQTQCMNGRSSQTKTNTECTMDTIQCI